MDLGVMLAAFLAAAAALGGIWLDRSFEQKDLRYEVYVQWLQYTDRQYEFLRKQAFDPDNKEIAHEFFRQESAAISPIRLLASTEVLEKIEGYFEVYDKAFERLVEPAVEADSEDLSEAIMDLQTEVDGAREAVIQAMREELARLTLRRRHS